MFTEDYAYRSVCGSPWASPISGVGKSLNQQNWKSKAEQAISSLVGSRV